MSVRNMGSPNEKVRGQLYSRSGRRATRNDPMNESYAGGSRFRTHSNRQRLSNFSLNRCQEAASPYGKDKKSSLAHYNSSGRPQLSRSIFDIVQRQFNQTRTNNLITTPKKNMHLNLGSARDNSSGTSVKNNHYTTSIRSYRPHEIKQVNQTQIIPMQKLLIQADSNDKLGNQKEDATGIFRQKRNRHNKLNIQAKFIEQRLKNLTNRPENDKQTEMKERHLKTEAEEAENLMNGTRLKWKTYLFDLKNYSYIRQLGKGGYARVILCRHQIEQKLYAVKIYDKLLLESKSKISNIRRELKVMETLSNHPNISCFKESIENKTTTFIIMEYCPGQSLFAELKKSENQRFDEQKAKFIFSQIVDAVVFMKKKGIVHRDIKAQNILLDRGRVKLIDFGFSIFCQSEEQIDTYCGTPTYMSPEIVARYPYNPYKSDVWSLGVLLYLMLHGSYPFFSLEENALFAKIQRGKCKISSSLSPQAHQAIKWMLLIHPDRRISIEELPSLSWLH